MTITLPGAERQPRHVSVRESIKSLDGPSRTTNVDYYPDCPSDAPWSGGRREWLGPPGVIPAPRPCSRCQQSVTLSSCYYRAFRRRVSVGDRDHLC